jgi:hypothetical protein
MLLVRVVAVQAFEVAGFGVVDSAADTAPSTATNHRAPTSDTWSRALSTTPVMH